MCPTWAIGPDGLQGLGQLFALFVYDLLANLFFVRKIDFLIEK